MVNPSAQIDGLNIWVVDNFLPAYEHEAMSQYCHNSLYTLKHVSNSNHEYPVPRLAAHLTDEQVKDNILTKAFFEFAGAINEAVDIEIAYINMANSATVTTEHLDSSAPGLTMLYYPNAYWKLAWGGETLFFDNNQEIAFASIVKPNRAIFFDPRILHTARPPTVLATVPRYTFVYKSVPKVGA